MSNKLTTFGIITLVGIIIAAVLFVVQLFMRKKSSGRKKMQVVALIIGLVSVGGTLLSSFGIIQF